MSRLGQEGFLSVLLCKQALLFPNPLHVDLFDFSFEEVSRYILHFNLLHLASCEALEIQCQGL